MTNKNELNEKELNNISGGVVQPTEEGRYGTFHSGCKGKIKNIGNPFKNCKCAKCGESHYWRDDFKRYIITKLDSNKYMLEYIGGQGQTERTEYVYIRPEELDWPCNK